MKTKYGTAKLDNDGYLRIKTTKQGNHGKLLHRLVFEDYNNCKLDKTDVIHHIDGDKTNNHPNNLICMSRKAHTLLHHYGKQCSEETKRKISENNAKYWEGKTGENHNRFGKHHSEESKNKISESCKGRTSPMKGKHHSDEAKQKISESSSKRNTTGYYRVTKKIDKTCKQGFIYDYQYYNENGKRKHIVSVDVEKLEEKVKAKGLEWREI